MTFASLFAAVLLTNAQQVAEAVRIRRVDADFALEAQVVYHYDSGVKKFILRDATGLCEIHSKQSSEALSRCADGDVVRLSGKVERGLTTDDAYAVARDFRRLASGAPPEPVPATATEIAEGRLVNSLVSVEGVVVDAFRDELDVNFSWLVLRLSDGDVFVTIPGEDPDMEKLRSLADARVSLVGFCESRHGENTRKFLDRIVMMRNLRSVKVLCPPPHNPFDVEDADSLQGTSAARFFRSGKRRVAGHVLAVWSGNKVLVRCEAGCLHDVELAETPAPAYGDCIEVVGFPETDLYKINLSRARWRRLGGRPFAEPPVERKDIHDVLAFSRFGTCGIDTRYHGRRLELTGKVVRLPAPEDVDRTVGLECGNDTIPVDVQACPDVLHQLSAGCVVSVAGTCVLRTENRGPNVVMPRVSGCTLVLCRPQDMRVLRHPPWWTVRNLFIVIGALLVALAGILVWNRVLNRIVERRGRELMRTRVARDEADLKTEERMRLAVELHDTLSQELAGVSMLIDAAKLAAENEPQGLLPRLTSACQRMRVCRENLRYCLWDLRNRPFDMKHLSDAIRCACQPVLGDVELKVDATLSSRELSDNSAHGVFCIVRELVANAIRHGHARCVSVRLSKGASRVRAY